MTHAIEVLKQEAIKLSGEIVAEELLKKDIANLGDSSKIAIDLLFGGFSREAITETDKKLIEVIKAIKILKEKQS